MDKKVTIYDEFLDDIEEVLYPAYCHATDKLSAWAGRESCAGYKEADEALKACDRLMEWLRNHE